MSRGRRFGSAATLCFLVAIPARAAATPVTLAFSGTVDFSSVGGAAASTFSGTATWDTTTPGFPTLNPAERVYRLTSATFGLNGVDYSVDTDPCCLSAKVTDSDTDKLVVDIEFFCGDPQLCSVGSSITLPGFTLPLRHLLVEIGGTSDMLSSLSLPTNLGFLDSATSVTGSFLFQSFEHQETIASSATQASPTVPEPATVALVGSGIFLTIRRHRKTRALNASASSDSGLVDRFASAISRPGWPRTSA